MDSPGPELLAELAAERGMDTFVFAQAEEPDTQLRRLASEVIPRTRDLLSAGAGPASP